MASEIAFRFQHLVLQPGAAQLGPQPRDTAFSEKKLEQELGTVLVAAKIPADRSDLVRALLLLWHDHLDASHTISQGIESPDGSLVHAIMHRREPDYGNSKYWWRRVGKHPCFEELAARGNEFLAMAQDEILLAQLVPSGAWDPYAFVDACAAASAGSKREKVIQNLRGIQQIETQVALKFFLRDHVELEFPSP